MEYPASEIMVPKRPEAVGSFPEGEQQRTQTQTPSVVEVVGNASHWEVLAPPKGNQLQTVHTSVCQQGVGFSPVAISLVRVKDAHPPSL